MSEAETEVWRSRLASGDASGAWDLFIDRYRPLILATVRRTLPDTEDRMEAFAHVCEGLAADGLARLRRFQDGAGSRARFSTWLVTVVHHQLVDWLRKRDGRPRLKPPQGLTHLQQRIFTRVFVEQHSHSEAYELLRAEPDCDVRFSTFLRELAEIYRIIEQVRPGGVMHYLSKGLGPGVSTPCEDPPDGRVAAAEIHARLAPALASLSAEEQVALRLYVVERVPARDVARVLGWAGPKTVYNRVYRSLMHLRGLLEGEGLGPDDF